MNAQDLIDDFEEPKDTAEDWGMAFFPNPKGVGR